MGTSRFSGELVSDDGQVHAVRTGAGTVEVSIRLPHASTRVTIDIDIDIDIADTPAVHNAVVDESDMDGTRPDLVVAASGRQRPKLLFVTSLAALAHNIGHESADYLATSLRRQGWELVDVPDRPGNATRVAAVVRPDLARDQTIEGVVLIGGYDVIPAQRVDTLDLELRGRVPQQVRRNETDNFIVWSDDIYGCRDGDGLPELPVSRIPDGQSADLVFNAIGTSSGRSVMASPRSGVRNVMRPFAEEIYNVLPGSSPLHVSEPATSDLPTVYDLAADRVYLMLHGSESDGSRFWGETDGDFLEVVSLDNVPNKCGAVTFTGCCHGALSADPPAGIGMVGHCSPGVPTARSRFGSSRAARSPSSGVRDPTTPLPVPHLTTTMEGRCTSPSGATTSRGWLQLGPSSRLRPNMHAIFPIDTATRVPRRSSARYGGSTPAWDWAGSGAPRRRGRNATSLIH